MKILCAFAAIAFVIAFTAVNLFIPYALVVFIVAIGFAAFLGIPCGFLDRNHTGECRLGHC